MFNTLKQFLFNHCNLRYMNRIRNLSRWEKNIAFDWDWQSNYPCLPHFILNICPTWQFSFMYLGKSICILKVTKSQKESEIMKRSLFYEEGLENRLKTVNTISQCFSQPRFILLQIYMRRSGDALVNHLKIWQSLQLTDTTKAMPWGRQICSQYKPHLHPLMIKFLLTNVKLKKRSGY